MINPVRIWLVGRHGQAASALRLQLAQQPQFHVWASGRHETDIRNRHQTLAAAAAFRPDIIINTAAFTDVDAAERHPEQADVLNHHGVRHLAEAAQTHGAVLLHLSTDHVFDGRLARPYREDDVPHPVNAYGRSKLAGERAATALCPRSLIVRTSWLFGAPKGGFAGAVVRAARARSVLDMVDGQTAAPTAAADLAAALVRICLHLAEGRPTEFGIYHFCGTPAVSRRQWAQTVLQAAVRQGHLPAVPELRAVTAAQFGATAARPADSRLHCGRLQHCFGITPAPWQHALQQMNDWSIHG